MENGERSVYPVATPPSITIGQLANQDPESAEQVHQALLKAFVGPDALGVIAVRDIPDLGTYRRDLLPLAAQFASLPESARELYEHPESKYSVGWSHGKEKLSDEGYDLLKGSYYGNPTCNDEAGDVSPDLVTQFPSLYKTNVWPTEHVPQLQGAFQKLGRVIVSVAASLLSHCDALVLDAVNEKRDNGENGEDIIKENALLGLGPIAQSVAKSRAVKGRLLHYFPSNGIEPASREWCSWHTDHGTITGLVSSMFLSAEDLTADAEVKCPDPTSGLHVRKQSGEVVKVNLAPDEVGFQAGECLQIASGGMLRATPHMVQSAAASAGLSRNTFAVFLQPDADTELKAFVPLDTIGQVGVQRWSEGQTFGQFSEITVEANYG